MFSNKDVKNLIVPLFLEQLLMALVGIADVFVIGYHIHQFVHNTCFRWCGSDQPVYRKERREN